MTRPEAWAFDAYGTLLDPHGLAAELERLAPGKGAQISATWRETQLRYTWLRSLMDRWAPFDVVTRDALLYACRAWEVAPDAAGLERVLDLYRRLPAYADVRTVLAALASSGVPLAILSNGTRAMVAEALEAAGIADAFAAILSSDEVNVYKPHPRMYALATSSFALPAERIGFVSGNGWDCAGAAAFGFQVVRVLRVDAPHEELGAGPRRTVRDLGGLLTDVG